MKKRKVYIFNSNSRAAAYGIGTYIHQLTECLKSACIDFDIINLNTEGNEATTSIEKGYRRISIPKVSFRNQKDMAYYHRNVAYLLDEYITYNNDIESIFHLNFMTNPQLVSILKKRFRCKTILICHYTLWSFGMLGNEKKLLSILDANARRKTEEEKQICKSVKDDVKMIKMCDRFVCVAQHSLYTFNKVSDIDQSKCVIINNALQDEYKNISIEKKTTLRSNYCIPDGTKIILFVGRLDEVKGIASLLKAFKGLLKLRSDVHLILAGDGDFSTWMKEAADCWMKISFTGRLDKRKITELYQIADIGVVSSIHEEFGFVAIEMMMHRIPIIVGDTGGLSEIVEDHISGLKVPIRTIKGKRTISHTALTDKMNLLLSEQSLADTIAENGRKRFLEKYEISLFKKKMTDLYLDITNCPSKKSHYKIDL